MNNMSTALSKSAPVMSWIVLFILAAIYAQNQWSRYSLNYLYAVDSESSKKSIKVADSISYSEYGVLTGFGFSATFCIAGLFAGRAADVASRTFIIFLGVCIWNCALLLMAYTHNFGQVLALRLLLGIGQALSNPASYSLIADIFPEAQRAKASGLFAAGVYVGGGLASVCIAMAQSMGWRGTCVLIATIGFILGGFEYFLVKEPQRGNFEKNKQPKLEDNSIEDSKRKKVHLSFSASLYAIFTNRFIVIIFLASSLRFCGGYAIAGYLPTFYSTVFPSYTTEYSYVNAYVVSAGGFLSSWLGGLLADKWHAFEPKARLYLPALGCFVSLPFMAICCLAPNFYISIFLGLFLEYLFAESWFGAAIASLQSSLEPECRALAIACFTLIATFFGSLTSYIIGVVYELLLSNGSAAKVIQWVVLWSVVASYVSAGLMFLLASQYVNGGDPSSIKQAADERKSLLQNPGGTSTKNPLCGAGGDDDV
mmetsp:Transcript_21483/g.32945  ORF Transcript_21483/g.32945 Transcript_21483/m.32945 type:complete len:482 (-) Transcript_21483:1509-2954(-)